MLLTTPATLIKSGHKAGAIAGEKGEIKMASDQDIHDMWDDAATSDEAAHEPYWWVCRDDGYRILCSEYYAREIACAGYHELSRAIDAQVSAGYMSFNEAKRLIRQVPIHLRGKYA